VGHDHERDDLGGDEHKHAEKDHTEG
jgi:hypothetical protein